jgi:hypothetical protein
MNKEEILCHALTFNYGGMKKNELSCLYDICKDKKVLELGSYVGMSSYVIASIAKILHCVDIWDDSFTHLQHDTDQQSVYISHQDKIINTMNLFTKNCIDFIQSQKIIIHKGKTCDLVNMFEDENFDIIIIDADHSYEGVKNDYKNYCNKVNKNGMIIFHDYGAWQGVTNFCNEIINDQQIKIIYKVEYLIICQKC